MSNRALNTNARTAFTVSLTAVPTKAVTLEDCMHAGAMVLAERGEDEFDALVTRFGCKRVVQDLLPVCYAEFYEYAQIILTRGVSANYGWSKDSIPNRLRDRWLLWHAESECYWEVRGKLSADDLRSMEFEQVIDVSGIPWHEEAWREQQGKPLSTEDEL